MRLSEEGVQKCSIEYVENMYYRISVVLSTMLPGSCLNIFSLLHNMSFYVLAHISLIEVADAHSDIVEMLSIFFWFFMLYFWFCLRNSVSVHLTF